MNIRVITGKEEERRLHGDDVGPARGIYPTALQMWKKNKKDSKTEARSDNGKKKNASFVVVP